MGEGENQQPDPLMRTTIQVRSGSNNWDQAFNQAMLATRQASAFGADHLGITTDGESVHDRLQTTSELSLVQAGPLAVPGDANGERYHVISTLGHGGGGVVYRVADRALQREIALKVVHRRQSSSNTAVANLMREARITADLEHPGILPVHELGEDDDGRVYFTMRLATGIALDQVIEEWEAGGIGPLRLQHLDERIDVVLAVCEALRCAHDRGYVHQDIKPANIMVGDYGEVLLLDWGAAVKVDEHVEQRMVGTPMYLSPEQARRERVDLRSDIYCLGATMYHFFTGCLPLRDADPESFWAKKRNGRIDPLPEGRRGLVPESLMAIIQRCLHPDPNQRHRDVRSLEEDLRSYRHNLASLRLSEGAWRDLHAAGGDVPYATLQAIAQRFRNALDLWPENHGARDGLVRAQADQAQCALDRGDLVLAGELLDPMHIDHQPLIARLQEQQQTQRRLRLAWGVGAAAAGVVMLVLAGLFWHERSLQSGDWITVLERDFQIDHDHPLVPGAGRSRVPESTADGVLLPDGQLYWIDGLAERGDVRITCEVTWPEAVDGFEIAVRAKPGVAPSWWQPPPGYICQFGGYKGAVHILDAQRTSRPLDQVHSAPARLQPDRRYRLRYQVVDGIQSLFVDGRLVLTRRQLLPLAGGDHAGIALRSWSDIKLHAVRVERLSLPQRSSPLVAADGLVAFGHYAEALEQYRSLAEDYAGTQLETQALLRACLCAQALPDRQAEARRLLRRLRDRDSDHPDLLACEENACEQQWSRGHHAQALARAADILTRYPESRVAVKILRHRPPIIEPAHADGVLQLLGRTTGIVRLALEGWGVQSLEPLRGMTSLRSLDVQNNRITDLAPLQGLALDELQVKGNPIESMAPLAGMPLRQLNLSNTLISDLSMIAELPVQWLSVAGMPLRNLEVVRGKRLRYLNIAGTPVVDCSPLAGMPLRTLDLTGTAVANLEPLRGLPLDHLNLAQTQVRDISPLAGMPLQYLDLTATTVSVIDDLAGMPLRHLFLSHSAVRELTPLAESRSLRWLSIHGCPVGSLAPLVDLRLEHMDVGKTPVRDLSPLEQHPLEHLTISPQIIDVRTLADVVPNRYLDLAGGHFDRDDLQWLLQAWQQRQGAEHHVRRLRIDGAVARDDTQALRAFARSSDGVDYLATEFFGTLAEARAFARSHGARLPAPTTVQQLQDLTAEMADGTCWVDVRTGPGAYPTAPDGSPLVTDLLFPMARYHEDDYWLIVRRGAQGILGKPGGLQPEAPVVLAWDAH